MTLTDCVPSASIAPRVQVEWSDSRALHLVDEESIEGSGDEYETTSGETTSMRLVEERAVEGLARRYAEVASHLAEASVECLPSGEWFAAVPGLPGLWGSGSTPQECVKDFREAAYSWVMVKIEQKHGDIPVLGDIDLNIF